jgi:Zn-dependent metalloprotease
MEAPGSAFDDPVLGKDPQPSHMRRYVRTLQDNGGVHINSGIPNKAFHLAATSIGGHAWDKAGRIWYHALLDPATLPSTRFRPFAQTTLKVADRLYGAGSEKAALKDAWRQVGIRV